MPGFQPRLQSYIQIGLKLTAILGSVTIFIMMFWGALDVILQLFGYSVPATVAWTEILNAIALSLPLTYVTWKESHINVDLVTNKLSGKAKSLTEIGALIVVFLFSGLLAWQLSIRAWKSLLAWEFDQVTINIYWFPGRIALALGFIGTTLVVISQIINKLRR